MLELTKHTSGEYYRSANTVRCRSAISIGSCCGSLTAKIDMHRVPAKLLTDDQIDKN